jgi:Tfp pilus assembly protein PilF
MVLLFDGWVLEVLFHLERVVRFAPKFAIAKQNLAYYLHTLDDHKRAETLYHKTLALNPKLTST